MRASTVVIRWIVRALAIVMILAGCDHQSKASPVTGKEWHAVIADWSMHGRLAQPHSCAAVVVARTRVVPAYHEGAPLVHALDLSERSACHGWWESTARKVKIGMSDRAVADIAGAPVPWLSGPHCWTYRTSARTICFNQRGYVDRILFIVHG
jgi:hypothetical protein